MRRMYTSTAGLAALCDCAALTPGQVLPLTADDAIAAIDAVEATSFTIDAKC
jgi:hypothetical protein